MSSYVTSDHTVLAIVEGMRKYKLIGKGRADAWAMTEALRFMNEHMTTKRYADHSQINDHALCCNHQPVTSLPREYDDGEMLAACRCWRYQVDCDTRKLQTQIGDGDGFDFLTIFEAVKLLEKKIVSACKANGSLKVKCYFGEYKYFFERGGEYVEMHELYGWDLEEMPKAA